MKKSIKKFLLCGVVTTIALSSSLTSYAGQWKQDSIGWWWQEDNGSYPVSAWKKISDKWYYFEPSGYMAANKWIDNYYVAADGAMLVNTITPDGYTVGADGAWIESIPQKVGKEETAAIQEINVTYIPWNWPLSDAYTTVQENNRMFWYSNNKVIVNDAYVYGLHVRYYKADGSLCHPNDGGTGYKPAVQAECVLTRTPFNNEQVGQMEVLHSWGRMPYQYHVTNQITLSMYASNDGKSLNIGFNAPDSTSYYYFYNLINGTVQPVDYHTYYYGY